VRARRTELVKDATLTGFLMGRNPIEHFETSNGHGRKQPGLPPVARQGNLVVTSDRSVERAELEKMLLDEVKRQGRPYGMVFTDISGGFTNTSAFGPQSFKVNPTMASLLTLDQDESQRTASQAGQHRRRRTEGRFLSRPRP
jgi:hypothetical protein